MHDLRRLDRLRGRRRLVLLLTDRDDRGRLADARRRDDARGRGRLVRSPVGRLHLGRWRRLGLVRGEPRGRHGPEPVARSRCRRQLPAGLRHARGSGRDRPASRPATRSRSRSRTAGRARRPAPTIRPAGRSRSRPRTCRSTLRPTVAAQELDTRATTGVIYWEGSQVVAAARGGERLGGEAYVELTGYGGIGRGGLRTATARVGARPAAFTTSQPPARPGRAGPRAAWPSAWRRACRRPYRTRRP